MSSITVTKTTISVQEPAELAEASANLDIFPTKIARTLANIRAAIRNLSTFAEKVDSNWSSNVSYFDVPPQIKSVQAKLRECSHSLREGCLRSA